MLDKERDFKFCCPPDLRAKTIRGSRPDFTCLDQSTAVAIEVFSRHVSAIWVRRKERFSIFFFFWV